MTNNILDESIFSEDPDNPNWTKPKSWGVWELPINSLGKKFRIGNNPIRGKELVNEFGSAKLVALFNNRETAEEHAAKLNI